MRNPKSDSHYWKILILLLLWLWPVARACADYELMLFKPGDEPLEYPYECWYSGTNTSTANYNSMDTKSKAVANADNGGLSVFVWAWFGGTGAYASQYLVFYAPEACHVHGTVRMSYSGSAFRKGPNEWAGTDWYWALDGLPPHDYDIDKMFSFETVTWQIIDWALLAALIADCAFDIPGDIALAMFAVEAALEADQLAADMTHLIESIPSNGERIEEDIHFTVPEGWHVLYVGFHAEASAAGFGTGGAFMKGQLEKVQLALNTDAGEAPDLIVNGIRVENQANIRTQQRTKIHVSRCNVGNTTAEPESWLLEAIPANGGPTEMIHASGAPYAIIPPYTTPEDCVSYVFTNKGKYTLHAVTDPEHRVAEIDEANNERSVSIYVHGNPPCQPQAPNWWYSPVTLHRNQSCNFVTASSDIDLDPISYMFQVRAEGSTNWISLINRLNDDGSGWSGWSNIWLTPIVPELEFGPRDNSGVDPRTWWMVYTNRYYMRALAGDVDGVSVPSTETPIDVVMNTLPASMAISGNSAGSTLVPYVLTVSNYDAEGDLVGFRFKWGDSYANPWSEWQWCPSGQATVTVSHVYGSPSDSLPFHYNIYVQATDLYAYQHGGGTTPAVLRTVYISNYFATSNILVTTKDTGTQLALPNVRGGLQAGTYGLSFVTDGSGQWTTDLTPDTTNCTVTFSNVDGYVTPLPETQILTPSTPNLSLQFTGLYAHNTGRIFVSCNVNGQGEIYGSGSASGSYYTFNGYTWNSDPYAWLGPYTVYFAPVDPTNYSLPSPSVVSNKLTESGSLIFTGHYPHRPIAILLSQPPTNAYNPPNTFVLVNEEKLALDASNSYSPETGPGGQPLPLIQYQFFSDDGGSYTESSNAPPDGAFDGKVQYVFRKSGRHRQVQVKVTDANGVTNWVCTPVDVWVKDRPGASFTLNPSPAIAGENVAAHGDGTVSYPGDTISRYEWTLNQG